MESSGCLYWRVCEFPYKFLVICWIDVCELLYKTLVVHVNLRKVYIRALTRWHAA